MLNRDQVLRQHKAICAVAMRVDLLSLIGVAAIAISSFEIGQILKVSVKLDSRGALFVVATLMFLWIIFVHCYVKGKVLQFLIEWEKTQKAALAGDRLLIEGFSRNRGSYGILNNDGSDYLKEEK